MLRLWIATQVCLNDACWSEYNMATSAILNLEKLMLFSHFHPMFTKLGKLLRLWKTTHICYPKRLVTRIQHGGYRHLEFRKTDADLTFFPIFTKYGRNVETLNDYTCMLSKNTWWPKSNMAAAAILNSTKLMLFLHLFDQISSNLIGMLLLWIKTHAWRKKRPVARIQFGGCGLPPF